MFCVRVWGDKRGGEGGSLGRLLKGEKGIPGIRNSLYKVPGWGGEPGSSGEWLVCWVPMAECPEIGGGARQGPELEGP